MGEEVPREWSGRWRELRADRRVAAGLFACVAIAAGAAWLRAGVSSAGPSSAAVAPAKSPTTRASDSVPTTKPLARLVIDVVGAVRRGGVVRVAAGARVIDAIAAAGGATADADLARLNLAAPVSDGERIAVPRVGEAAPALDPAATSGTSVDGTSAAGPVNLNSATAAQLDALPGIGPATAAAIVHDRDAHGPYRAVDDLTRVRGIGKAKLEQLRDLVTV